MLPRALIGWPGEPPPPLERAPIKLSKGRPPVGVDIGYGAPWEGPQAREHLWRNRPCCFLHFVIQLGRPVPGARAAILGGRRGRLLPASSSSYGGPYFRNHVRFFFRDRGVPYVATLHSFGTAETTALLGRLVAELRPLAGLRARRASIPGTTVVLPSPGPRAIATTPKDLWILTRDKPIHNYASPESRGALPDVDSTSGHLRRRITINGGTRGLAASGGAVWVAAGLPVSASESDGVVLRVDPSKGRIVATVPTGTWPAALAADAKGVWAVNTAPFFKRGTLVRISAATNRPEGHPIPLGPAPSGVTVGAGAVWVADAIEGTVRRIDAARRRTVATIRVGRQPYGLAFAAGSVWVTNSDGRTVTRIDPTTDKVSAVIRVGRNPYGIAAGSRSVWVANLGSGSVSRIDASSGRVVKTIRVGGDPLNVALVSGAPWFSQNSEGALTRLD